jgi:dihydroorotate dehydrogenase (NAD+) catalytic subunit
MSNTNTQWFYDPNKTFDQNMDDGPYFDSIPELERTDKPRFDFLGFPIYLPFGIAAGTLPTAKHVKAAFDWGYDVATYKTMRSVAYPANQFPNIIPIETSGDVTLDQAESGLIKADDYPGDYKKIVITNSFGNSGRGPDYWVDDMKIAAESAGLGQVMIASAFGTPRDGDTSEDFWQDFADTAKMQKDAGAKIIELNLSCPNVVGEGIVCYTKEAVVGICERTKKAIGTTPLLIKLGYFSDEQQTLLEEIIAEVDQYIAGVSLINTILAKVYDKNGNQALPGEGRLKSGLCGAGIKWAGLEMVKRLADLRDSKGYQYQIVGVGGVMTPDDFFEYREVGADLVQACTGPMWNPNLAREIAQQF